MEFKGTKDNWKLRGNKTDITTEKKGLIITCYKNYSLHSNINPKEAEANALLISKAPEMLKMLSLLVDRLQENDLGNLSATIKAKQLIKEATEI